MAAKHNTSKHQISLSTYDYVVACGQCHPGGGIFEYARDAGGEATAVRHPEAEAAAADPVEGTAVDGDYTTLTAVAGQVLKSRFDLSGVVEADCLLCHLADYNMAAKVGELNKRNYKWAATAAARLGTVTGAVVSGGAFTGATPTVTYDVSSEGTKFVPFGGGHRFAGAQIQRKPLAANCLLCHEASDTKKRGLEWTPEKDVHAARYTCVDCHGMVDPQDDDGVYDAPDDAGHHNIGKGYERLGTVRNDLDGTMKHTCASCHTDPTDSEYGAAPDPAGAHAAAFPGVTSFHFAKIACEGCHIPSIQDNQGYLINMSSGTQWWVLSDGRTPGAPADFNSPYLNADGSRGSWRPHLKMWDPDGPAGPLPAKYYTFGAKSSVWFGDLKENGEVQPLILRHVTSAYNAVKATLAQPTVPVSAISGSAARPSVALASAGGADVAKMLVELSASQNGHPAFSNPVYVSSEGVFGLGAAGQVVAKQGNGETDHNFSINHDVRPAAEALGAKGCADCHSGDVSDVTAPLVNTQVRDVTGYLTSRSNTTLDPAAIASHGETMYEARGYGEEQGVALLAVSAASPVSWHAGAVSYAFDGANTCAECHADAVAKFKATTHYGSQSPEPNENFFFPGGGRHGMVDRACALVGTNMLLNMLTTSYLDPNLSGAPAQQCGTCHTNYYLPLMEGFVAQQFLSLGWSGEAAAAAGDRTLRMGIDCLVCHAEEYDFGLRTTYEADPTGLNASFGTLGGVPQRIRQDRSSEALASLVGKPSDEMCLRCHEHARTDYKRGELPEAEYDIHYQLGVSSENPCLFCHEARDHKFNRGQMVNGDIFASDYPVNGDENDTNCGKCHTVRPHASARLNDHVAKIACETCHITWTSGAEATIWGDGGFLALAKGGAENRAVKLYTMKEADRANSSLEQVWERYKQRPVYMPFSGLTTFLAQSVPLPNPNIVDAKGNPLPPKIYPFKTVINPLPFDGRFFGIGGVNPDADGDGVNDYSMFAALRTFEVQYKQLGFMDADFDFDRFALQGGMLVTTVAPTDPKYPSYAAMAQMAQFPNLLSFDKYTFGSNWYEDLGVLADAGKITLWDYDADTKIGRPLAPKNLKEAVRVGMGRMVEMMFQMGFRPAGLEGQPLDSVMVQGAMAQFKAAYDFTGAPDQLVVMSAPPGSEMQAMLKQMGYANWPNYPAYSNGITLGGHGVRREEALFCGDCHGAASPFSQKVEVPKYGAGGYPLFHWEFYDRVLLAKASAGDEVDDVYAAGYVKVGPDFEMSPAAPMPTASAAAGALGITYGSDGAYIAVLVPTTASVSNWKVLGYSDADVARLTSNGANFDGTGEQLGDDVESDKGGSSECFVQSVAGAGSAGWLAALLAAMAVGLGRRRR